MIPHDLASDACDQRRLAAAPLLVARAKPVPAFRLYFTALYVRSAKDFSAGSFERVSNLEENGRRVQIAWWLTMSVESSPV
jgi:hypothetical protein